VNNAVLKVYKNRCWGVAELFVDDIPVMRINKYFKVTNDWVVEYDCVGGHDNIRQSDDVIAKYYIGDCNFKIKEMV
jgi:hypothetical protein